MFTGIVEEMGTLQSLQQDENGYQMTFQCKRVLAGTQLGDSIAVDGTCLTVTHLEKDCFRVGVAPETRARTNLAQLNQGDQVNLERAVTPTTRLGGHYVQGHVDGTATITKMHHDGEALWIWFRAPNGFERYIVPKGFICLDGASLTIVECQEDQFSVMLVPFTQKHITMSGKKVGDLVNLEVDILGKYVEKLLASGTVPRPPETEP